MPSAARPSLWTLDQVELPRGKFSSFRGNAPGQPSVNPDWHAPPLPSWGRKKVITAGKEITVEDLQERAAALRQQAEALNVNAPAPSVRIQLGQLLLTMDGKATEAMMKKWDVKGRGEFMKAEMRLNLRNTGLNVTSAESDALFDTWDDDGGGSLDLKELRGALNDTMKEAKEYNTRPDPAQQHMQMLLKRAALAEDAAAATAQADAMDRELEEFSANMLSRADVRLGELLQKRMIKPGEFVVRFSKSQGASAGELSKADFRKAVMELFQSKKSNTSPRPRSPPRGKPGELVEGTPPQEEAFTSPSEIDAVFDQCARHERPHAHTHAIGSTSSHILAVYLPITRSPVALPLSSDPAPTFPHPSRFPFHPRYTPCAARPSATPAILYPPGLILPFTASRPARIAHGPLIAHASRGPYTRPAPHSSLAQVR